MVEKSQLNWHPTKFVYVNGSWLSSRESVTIGSRLNSDHIAREYAKLIGQYAKGDLIDLGCGDAPLLGMYQGQVSNITLVDWPNSPHQRIAPDYKLDLNGPLPFGDSSFDTIVLSDVLEHIALPDQLIHECSRILRKGGQIIIGVPFLYGLHEEPHDYHRYTKHKLVDLAVRNSLSILELYEYAGGLHVVQDLTTKFLSYSRWTKWLAYCVHYSSSLVLNVTYIERRNRTLMQKFPLGYMAVLTK